MAESQQPQTAPGESTGSRLNRRTLTQAAVGAAALGIAASLTGWSAARHFDAHDEKPPRYSRTVVARRSTGDIPRDPSAASWKALPATKITLEPQRMIEPRLAREDPSPTVEVRAMHNGTEIGFHITWADSDRSDLEVAGRFRDSVAVQLPVTPQDPTFSVMGQPGRPVHLFHWRASWQRAMESGAGTVRHAFPNAVTDLSPEDLLKPESARRYYPALAAGNHMAQRERRSPVEELVAEGFGTTTSQAEQRANGAGIFNAGTWEVVIVTPMTGKQNQVSLRPGDRTAIAVAVWNGGKGHRGARKHFSYWSALEVEA